MPARSGLEYNPGVRLTRKLVVALVLAILFVLGVMAVIRTRREVRLFDTDMRRDHLVLGRALATAAARAWVTSGPDAAREMVAEANRSADHVRIRWVSLDADARAPDRPDVSGLTPGAELATRVEPAHGDDGAIYTYVPVPIGPRPPIDLELRESLLVQNVYLATTMRNTLLTTSLVVLVCGVLAAVLGYHFVGAPTRLLVAKAQKIGAGDLSSPLRLSQRDELGLLAEEMNAMCELLVAADSRVRSETAERLAALEQLRHADRLTTVGKLASGIAHELGTPLSVVAGRAQMIATGEIAGDDARDSARIVVEQARRITAIVRQLLDFARKRQASKQRCDVAAIVARTVAMLEPLARARGVNIELESPDLIEALVDDGQMQQVLTNVMVNALHATGADGTISVSIERRRMAPPEKHAATADYIVIAVADCGQGMAPEVVARVFEPFFTTKEVGDGTGLGLSVAYGIVREHGGFIDVRSTPGTGSVFTIAIPAGVAA